MYKHVFVAAVATLVSLPVMAQTPPVTNYAVRPGETINLGANYWVAPTCQNMALAKPDIEQLSGPAGLVFEFREAMVMPQNVVGGKSEIKGGYIWLTVPHDIEGTDAHVVLRITQHDRNGPQPRGYAFNLMIAR